MRLPLVLTLILTSLLNILCCAWIFLQFPLTKVETDWALEVIETKHLRGDLTDEEKEDFNFFKGWILANQKSTSEKLDNAKEMGIGLGLVFLLQNMVLFGLLNSRKAVLMSTGDDSPPPLHLRLEKLKKPVGVHAPGVVLHLW